MLEEVMVNILGQLKRIADAQEKFVELGEWDQRRLMEQTPERECQPDRAPEAESPTAR